MVVDACCGLIARRIARTTRMSLILAVLLQRSNRRKAALSTMRSATEAEADHALLASPAMDVERMHPCFSIGCSSKPMRSSIMCSTSWASLCPVSLERSFVAHVSHLKALRASKSFRKLHTLSGRHDDPGETFSECVRACTNFCKLLASALRTCPNGGGLRFTVVRTHLHRIRNRTRAHTAMPRAGGRA